MKKLFMLLMLAFFSVTSVKAQCGDCQRTDAINFATGVDVNNNLLAIGAFDGNWQITNAPASANLGALPAIPRTIANYMGGWWGMSTPALQATLTAGGRWMSPFPVPNFGINNPAPDNPFTFTYTFCVCADDSFNFQGLFNADDWAQLNIDGTTVLSTANNWALVFQYNQTVFLTAGVHTLNIDLRNLGSVAMGVNCIGTITAQNGTNLALRTCCNPTGSVNGTKYQDVNNNGVIDAADTPLPGWQFNLNGPGGSFSSTTNSFGVFNFANIPAGTYTLSEIIQPGWTPVLPAGGSTTVNVTVGGVVTINFLNKLTSRGCCDTIPSPDLIPNGSFEYGNTGFTSSYPYISVIAKGSVIEGAYSVVSGVQAGIISNCWNVPDHTTCTPGGHFMVVNGRTHTPGLATVYQQQNIMVTPNEEYIFCMYYRHLPQCEFDIFTPTSLNVQFQNATQLGSGCTEAVNDCGWTKLTFSIMPTTPLINISVTLNQAGIGDGNDVAFDDFSLRMKAPVPAQYCDFNIQTSGTGSPKTITATAVTNPLPAGFNVEWTVSEVNCSTWADIGTPMSNPTWNPNSTNFPGFGGFDVLKCYRITRRVTSCCYTPCEYTWYVSAQPQPMVLDNGGNPATEAGKDDLYMSLDHINWMRIDGGVSIASDDISLFPNPGDGNVTIQSGHSLENTTLTIYSSDSKVISKQRIDGRKGSVNINNLPSGVYSFELVEPDGTRTFKKYVKK